MLRLLGTLGRTVIGSIVLARRLLFRALGDATLSTVGHMLFGLTLRRL